MIPSFTDIQYFLVLCETLNMSRASEKLITAQSTISQALKRLEDNLQTELFIRRKNGLELTRAGNVFRVQAKKLIEEWEGVVAVTREAHETPRGIYTIGAHTSVASYTLPTFVPTLMSKYQELNLSLIHDSSSEILEGVISGRIDFGFIINPYGHPDLVIKKLCNDRYSFWRNSKNQNEEVLILNKNIHANEVLLKKLGTKKPFLRSIHSESFEVIAELVANGGGIGILPEKVARQRGLTTLQKDIYFEDSLFLCYRKDRQKSVGAKVIIEMITKTKI